jgi:uncharacterized membrane protein
MTTVSAEHASIQEYLRRISAGLKGIDETQKRETLAEISSHLNERAAELRAGGAPHPIEQAISGLGDPADLASAFVAVAQATRGIRSYAPWTLLRSAARVALSGTKGLLVFLMGVIGYGFALAGLVAAVLKPFIPEMGLWIGSWGVVWGVPANAANSRELLGRHFIDVSIALSFVFASTTTLLLRRLTKKISFFGKWPAS